MTMSLGIKKWSPLVCDIQLHKLKPTHLLVFSPGVTFCLVRNGLDDRTFEQGLREWRRRHPVEVTEDAAALIANDEVGETAV